MDLEDWKLILAAWGAVTGTIGASVALTSAVRDRSRLRLYVSSLAREEARKIHEPLAERQVPIFAFVEVINVGRRIRYVYQAEMWVTEDYLLVPNQPVWVYFQGQWAKDMQPWQSWRLEEGQSVTFVFILAKDDRIVRVYTPDGLGRKKYYVPFGSAWRWYYGRWRGGRLWKELRESVRDRKRTRHHEDD